MKKRILIFTIFVLVLFLICIIVLFFKYTNLSYIKLNKSDAALGIKPKNQVIDWLNIQDAKLPTSIAYDHSMTKTLTKAEPFIIKTDESKNKPNPPLTIALFGLDRRGKGFHSRSDVIMLLTMDYANKKVKLTSLMRDLYAYIDGHGYTKLNHAYAYGGPQLALKTINKNFNLAVRDFCTVDFFDMEKIVDSAGGIDMIIEKNEILLINNCIEEIELLTKKKLTLIKRPGLQHLSGVQAVAYARVRYMGRGDFDRTQRQRRILEALASKARHMEKPDAVSFVAKVLPYIETSMTRLQILDMAQNYFIAQPMELVESRFPMDGTYTSGNYGGVYYIKADMGKLLKQLHGYLYEDKLP